MEEKTPPPPDYLSEPDKDFLETAKAKGIKWNSSYMYENLPVYTLNNERRLAYVYTTNPIWRIDGWVPREGYVDFIRKLGDSDNPLVQQYLSHLDYVEKWNINKDGKPAVS